MLFVATQSRRAAPILAGFWRISSFKVSAETWVEDGSERPTASGESVSTSTGMGSAFWRESIRRKTSITRPAPTNPAQWLAASAQENRRPSPWMAAAASCVTGSTAKGSSSIVTSESSDCPGAALSPRALITICRRAFNSSGVRLAGVPAAPAPAAAARGAMNTAAVTPRIVPGARVMFVRVRLIS